MNNKDIRRRIQKLEAASTKGPDPKWIAWVQAELIKEGLDPDSVMLPNGMVMIGGTEKEYIGCLKVMVRDPSPRGVHVLTS